MCGCTRPDFLRENYARKFSSTLEWEQTRRESEYLQYAVGVNGILVLGINIPASKLCFFVDSIFVAKMYKQVVPEAVIYVRDYFNVPFIHA